MLRLRPGAVAEPDPRLKHRPSILLNVIAANRISYKPQKLQAKSATVKIGCDIAEGWAGGPEEMAAMPRSHRGVVVARSWISRGSAGEIGAGKGGGRRERPGVMRERGMATGQPGCSGRVARTSRITPGGWNEPGRTACLGRGGSGEWF